jgi:proteasome accessory factor B
MSYQPLGQEAPRNYLIEPLVLRRARGAWYLAARDRNSGYIPLLNLSRVRQVEPTGEKFDYAATGFEPGKYFESTFDVYEAKSRHRVKVEFTESVAQLIRERHWHKSQKLTDLPGGRLRLELTVSHLNDIRPWILSWGSEARVVKPGKLVEALGQEATAMAGIYGRGK